MIYDMRIRTHLLALSYDTLNFISEFELSLTEDEAKTNIFYISINNAIFARLTIKIWKIVFLLLPTIVYLLIS